MRLVLTLSLCLLGSTALAAECDRWTASVQEEEVGPLMTAAICASASSSTPEAMHHLFFQCAGEGNLWIRYLPFTSGDYPPGGNEEFKTQFEFALGQEVFTRDARFEGMDGAMAMDTRVDDPFISVMMSQKEFTLSDVSGKVPGATFTLKGARAAFDTLIKACRK